MKGFSTVLLPFIITSCAFAQGRQFSGAAIDSLVERVMKEFRVPGVSLAVVKDGRTLLAKGYCVKKLGDPAPVDNRTLFGIASNTKAFTATALVILIEKGSSNGTAG